MTTNKRKKKKIDWTALPYFAFGSNLNLQQMAGRCPTAENMGAAELQDWALTFRGVADVEQRKGRSVSGGLFKIDAACLKALDRYEGWPFLYVHRRVKVVDQNGDLVDAFIYVMNEKRHGRRQISMPSDWYFEVIREGFENFGLNNRPLYEALREVAHEVDMSVAPDADEYYCDLNPDCAYDNEYQAELALAF